MIIKVMSYLQSRGILVAKIATISMECDSLATEVALNPSQPWTATARVFSEVYSIKPHFCTRPETGSCLFIHLVLKKTKNRYGFP